ncbi:hypothetical protein T492DRAFT_857389 [Pavlovales sp. CCMP2436]|nr:hypothetical protein T492DRAFT_857389 [Pavlovales sp. CCMP2436]
MFDFFHSLLSPSLELLRLPLPPLAAEIGKLWAQLAAREGYLIDNGWAREDFREDPRHASILAQASEDGSDTSDEDHCTLRNSLEPEQVAPEQRVGASALQ